MKAKLQPKQPWFQENKSKQLHIPHELVSEILSRLPVASLLRFKCVCKRWHETIRDPKFICPYNTKLQSVFMSGDDPWGIHFDFTDVEGNNERFCWARRYDERSGAYVINASEILVGSCNGLLLVLLGKSFFLWNPLTRYFSKVLELEGLQYYDYRDITLGFCYDSSTDDYKVLISLPLCSVSTSVGSPWYIMVASLKAKRWRDVVNFHYYSGDCTIRGPIFNGFLHWAFEDVIMAFDPRIDEFKQLAKPPRKENFRTRIVGLGVFREKLCIAREYTPGHFIDLLITEKYGVKESWTTMFSMSVEPCLSNSVRAIYVVYNKNREVVSIEDGRYSNKKYHFNPPRFMERDLLFTFGTCFFGAHSFVGNLASPSEDYSWNKVRHGWNWINRK